MGKSAITAGLQSQITSYILNNQVEELCNFIDSTIEHTNPELLLFINQIIAIPSNLNQIIWEILTSPSLFAKVVEESYYHENGFHKIVLLSGKNFKLRLHHFGVATKIPMENIHDHRWPFASSIISGELKMDVFEISDNNPGTEELYHFIYGSNKSDGNYTTTLVGKVKLKKVETRKFNYGKSYLMLPEELHRIKNALGQESITVILTGKPSGSNCNLYAKRSILDKEKKIISYEPHALKTMLNEIIEKFYPQKN